jgi:acyl-CoA thioesterase-1
MLLLMISATAESNSLETPPTILIVGDSISAAYGIQRDAGWVSLLGKRIAHLDGAYRVVNASISGDTTAAARARLPQTLALYRPCVVILELGGNDALRGYPIDTIAGNLRALVETARKSGANVLLLGMQIPPNYGERYTQAFAAMYRSVATETDTPLVPFLLDGVATRAELMQSDGIHPTAAAQPKLLDNVWPTLQSLLGKRVN